MELEPDCFPRGWALPRVMRPGELCVTVTVDIQTLVWTPPVSVLCVMNAQWCLQPSLAVCWRDNVPLVITMLVTTLYPQLMWCLCPLYCAVLCCIITYLSHLRRGTLSQCCSPAGEAFKKKKNHDILMVGRWGDPGLVQKCVLLHVTNLSHFL